MGEGAGLRFELFSRDANGLRGFLETALGFRARRVDDGYIEMTLDDVVIGIGAAEGLPERHPLRPRRADERLGVGVEIVIEVEDVDSAYAAAQGSGVPIAVPLGPRAWGARDFRLVAPDGYYFRVTSRG